MKPNPSVDLAFVDLALRLALIAAAGTASLLTAITLIESDKLVLRNRRIWGVGAASWGLTLLAGWTLAWLPNLFGGFVYGPAFTLIALHIVIVATLFRVAVSRALIWVCAAFGLMGCVYLAIAVFYELYLRGPH